MFLGNEKASGDTPSTAEQLLDGRIYSYSGEGEELLYAATA
jgi:hypothetical protein